MQFDILDPNVSLTTNVFLVIANIINLFYNIPQMYRTYKCKSTKDFSTMFLLFRFIGNVIWVEYAVALGSFLMLLNNIVTVVSTLFIGYYKIKEIHAERQLYKKQINIDVNVENGTEDKIELIEKST
jgi:MtN3 and saliva related transmembrane protein